MVFNWPIEKEQQQNEAKTPASVIKTKCGHYFHKRCLLETKMRKANCPNCRAPLTPVTNPITVATAIQREELFSSSISDAVIHASHRGRNAVRLALLRQEEEQRRQEATSRASRETEASRVIAQ